MAGGNALEASLLETPTFVLSVVFFVFLALSFSFELAVHATQSFFIRRGRHGMATAVQKIVMELTLLGFVSLLLTALSRPLGHMCVDWSDTMADWTLESNIQGCPCCLAQTHGVSLCTQIDHECLWNVSSRKAYCDCSVTGTADYEAAGYGGYAASSQLHEECKPYRLTDAQFFVDLAVVSLRTISSELNMSVPDLCAELERDPAAEGDAGYGSIDPSTLGDDMEAWADMVDELGERRRRLLVSGPLAQRRGLLSVAGTAQHAARSGCGAQRTGSRSLLAGGGGAEGAEGGSNPLQLLLAQDPEAVTQRHLIPRISLFKCTGPFMSSACPDGQVPVISEHALHQMHIYLFLVAIFHVAVSVVQFLLGRVRLRLWRRWERQAQQAGADTTPLAAPPFGRLLSSAGRGSGGGLVRSASGRADAGPASNGQSISAAASSQTLGADVEAAAAKVANGDSGSNSQAGPLRLGPLLSQWWRRAQRRWRERHTRMPSTWHCLAEAGICIVQALSPDTVTRQNFLLMRAAWLASQPAPNPDTTQHGKIGIEEGQQVAPKGEEGSAAGSVKLEQQQQQQSDGRPTEGAAGEDAATGSSCGGCCSGILRWQLKQQQPGSNTGFVDHLLGCLEDDLPSFVGLSIEMGVVACVMLLLAGVTGLIGPLFLIVASALLLITDATLVALLRHSCRGGQPHRSAAEPPRWWRNPHLLLAIPIRLILFLCSFVYASVVLFAWQFGNHSCFFTSQGDVWGVGGLPWWTGIIWVAVMLLWVGLVTIPTFSLVVHPHRSKRALPAAHGHHHSHRHDAEAPPQGISMLLDVASRHGGSDAAAPKAGGLQQGDSQLAAVHGAALARAPGGGGISSQQAGPGLEAELLAEISKLRARVAQLEALQPSRAANGAEAGSEPAAPPPAMEAGHGKQANDSGGDATT